MEKGNDFIEIDVLLILKAIWKRLWLVILITVVGAAIALGVTMHFITPMYQATSLLYVNNSAVSIGEAKLSISSADISAAQSLVDTYIVILETRTVLEDVLKIADSDRSYDELRKMVSASAANGTEVIAVTVTSPDPVEARTLANTIANVLPNKIAYVIEGASVKLVEYAVTPRHKSSPSIPKNVAIGGLIGLLLICLIISVIVMMDNKIHDENYLLELYDIPVLASIPDFNSKGGKGYYKRYAYYGRPETQKLLKSTGDDKLSGDSGELDKRRTLKDIMSEAEKTGAGAAKAEVKEPEVKAAKAEEKEPEVKVAEAEVKEPKVKAAKTEVKESEVKVAEAEVKEPEVKVAEAEVKEPAVKAAEAEVKEPEVKVAEAEVKEPAVKAAEAEVKEPEVKAAKAEVKEPEVKAAKAEVEEPEVKAAKAEVEEPEVKAEKAEAKKLEVKDKRGTAKDEGIKGVGKEHPDREVRGANDEGAFEDKKDGREEYRNDISYFDLGDY